MSADKRMSAGEISLSETQQRAGWYVSRVTEGRHQDKRGAQLLRCSPNMFWRLRRGEGWTVERMSLAARVFGASFVDVVFGPITGGAGGRGNGLTEQISDLQARINFLAASLNRGVLGHRDPQAPVVVSPVSRDRASAVARRATDLRGGEAEQAARLDDGAAEIAKAAE